MPLRGLLALVVRLRQMLAPCLRLPTSNPIPSASALVEPAMRVVNASIVVMRSSPSVPVAAVEATLVNTPLEQLLISEYLRMVVLPHPADAYTMQGRRSGSGG
jgi:hypothetical protein